MREDRVGFALCVVVLILAPLGRGTAQQEGEPPDAAREKQVVQSETGISLNFQDADLRTVITALADVAGINIIYSDLPSRQVTLRTSTPISLGQTEELLENISEDHGLEFTRRAGVVRIGTAEVTARTEPARQQSASDTSALAPRLFVHRLRHARAENMAHTLGSLFGAEASMSSDGASQEVQSTDIYQQFERESDRLNERRNRGEVRSGINAVLEGPVEIVPDSYNNALLVLSTPADYETVRSAIDDLDVRPLQVLIEVLILEVRREGNLALGTSLDVPADDDGIGFEIEGLSAGDVALQLLGIGGIGADAILRVLASSSDVKIISRPVVLAQNNQQARIMVGDERPFVRLFRALPTEGAVRDQVVQFRNVGTELRIQPTINPDGFVNLSVIQEVSSATAEVQFGAPVISTREVETEVLVRDEHTAVLGGLVDRQTEKTTSGIPLLKDIPILGGLFGSTRSREVATELFVLLTPNIIASEQDLTATTERVRELANELDVPFPEPNLFRRLPESSSALPHPNPVPPPEAMSPPKIRRMPQDQNGASNLEPSGPA